MTISEAAAADDERVDATIAQTLADSGWCLIERFLSTASVARLAAEASAAWRVGEFERAGIGARQRRAEIRSDWTAWLDPAACGDAQRDYLDRLEILRRHLNQMLLLGLLDLEAHLAIYPPGAFYRRHLDQIQGSTRRALTCILYLNHDWTAADGGQLVLYTDPDDPTQQQRIDPIGGRLLTFLSDRFPHEVLVTHRDRLSLTGWFLRRA